MDEDSKSLEKFEALRAEAKQLLYCGRCQSRVSKDQRETTEHQKRHDDDIWFVWKHFVMMALPTRRHLTREQKGIAAAAVGAALKTLRLAFALHFAPDNPELRKQVGAVDKALGLTLAKRRLGVFELLNRVSESPPSDLSIVTWLISGMGSPGVAPEPQKLEHVVQTTIAALQKKDKQWAALKELYTLIGLGDGATVTSIKRTVKAARKGYPIG